ncbi:hypothetical protein J5N97_004305 [Dioscorea zingiberensis]|uniref:Endoplasmic reticulum vesicle transporter C-terminal domain-containing protein n=1 Tax=Dioscorea zingiberensis TaxID=325984 RepID=A0A9D5D710_9LILI|nr:hypothetical protein J5N97_004305 [Dioscorea zingiberensis]
MICKERRTRHSCSGVAFNAQVKEISHKIQRLSFGEYFPGIVNPLDGVEWVQQTPYGMYQYFLKVVPTVYTDINGHEIQSNQFSMTEHFRTDAVGRLQALPGVFFFYDLSPIKSASLKSLGAILIFFLRAISSDGVDGTASSGSKRRTRRACLQRRWPAG